MEGFFAQNAAGLTRVLAGDRSDFRFQPWRFVAGGLSNGFNLPLGESIKGGGGGPRGGAMIIDHSTGLHGSMAGDRERREHPVDGVRVRKKREDAEQYVVQGSVGAGRAAGKNDVERAFLGQPIVGGKRSAFAQ